MALVMSDFVEMAELEYRRDEGFRRFVDGMVEVGIAEGRIAPGTPLGSILGRQLASGLTYARELLHAYHSRSTQPQWQRALALESETGRPALGQRKRR